MAIKKTLLEIVQDILSDMDSEPVNSLSDTLEAEQVAAIVEQTFNDMVATRFVPEHREILKLTPLSDNLFPTHFHYPDNVNNVEKVWYDCSLNTNTDAKREYKEIRYCDPLDFLHLIDGRDGDLATVQTVDDKHAGTTLFIYNDRMPTYYTSFDDYYIVMDSFHATYDDTLQASKVRAYGTKYPVFDRFSDTYTPDIDENYFPYLIQESKSRVLDLLKGGTTAKVEQAAKRAKNHLANDKWRTKQGSSWNDYGR